MNFRKHRNRFSDALGNYVMKRILVSERHGPRSSRQVPTTVIFRSRAGAFVDPDILWQVREVTGVHQPIFFRNFALRVPGTPMLG